MEFLKGLYKPLINRIGPDYSNIVNKKEPFFEEGNVMGSEQPPPPPNIPIGPPPPSPNIPIGPPPSKYVNTSPIEIPPEPEYLNLEVEQVSIQTRNVSIRNDLLSSDPKNGTVTMKGADVTGDYLNKYFSFVLYLNEDIDKDNKFYSGLYAYLTMIHDNDYFQDCGMILYTDPITYPKIINTFMTYRQEIQLQKEIKFRKSKILAAMGEKITNLDNKARRAKRSKNMEFFSELQRHRIELVNQYNEVVDQIKKIEKNLDDLSEAIKNRSVKEGDFFGRYKRLIIAEVNWPYFSDSQGILNKPILRTLRYHALDYFPNKDIHIRDADSLFAAFNKRSVESFAVIVLQWEYEYLIHIESLRSKKQIIIGTHDEYTAEYHYNLAYPTPFQFPMLTNMQFDYQTEYNVQFPNAEHFLYVKRPQNPYGTSSKRQTFTKNFIRKYMFEKSKGYKIGVYAGFVSVLKDRKGIEDFWKLCTDYLFQRYRMFHNHTTNELFQSGYREFNTTNKQKFIGYRSGPRYAIGKDERMLLYAIIPKYTEKIFFFNVPYSLDENRLYGFAKPSYVKQEFQKQYNEYTDKFSEQNEAYQKWLQEFYAKYPTEDSFLNAVEKNLHQEIKPYNELDPSWYHPTLSNKSPYIIFREKGLFNRSKTQGGKRKKSRKTMKKKRL